MSTQPAWNRPRPHLEKEPQIRTTLRQAHLPQNRSCRQRVNTKTPTPAEHAPPGPRTASPGIRGRPLRGVLAVRSVRAALAHLSTHEDDPRICQALRVRPRRSADPHSPVSPSSIPSQESSCRQPRTSETPSPWRNVGAVLGSIRRLSEGPPKASWAPSTGLLDPASHIWGVRHHAPSPVSEWCS